MRNVSHELRTPLSIVLSYAEAFSDGYLGELSASQEKAVDAIREHAHALKGLIEQIETLLAAEAQMGVPTVLPLADLVAMVVARQRPELEAAGLTLSLELERDAPPVSGDVTQLRHAIAGLLDNARKFTPRGGRVAVRVYAAGDWICVAVSDTGPGIPRHLLPYVFNRFRQGDGSTTREYGGVGIGLALVKAVAEVHGGCVEVESERGQGSRFVMRLPASPAGEKSDPQARQHPPQEARTNGHHFVMPG